MPASLGANAGIDQTLTPTIRVSGTYTFRRSATLLRGRNLNAPIDGVRPDPRFGNVVDGDVNDAGSRTHTVGVTRQFHQAELEADDRDGQLQVDEAETNSTGAFSIPANGDDLSTEWGLRRAPGIAPADCFNMSPMAGTSRSA